MANLDLSKYGITDVKEIFHNPSYDVLFAEETKPELERISSSFLPIGIASLPWLNGILLISLDCFALS